MQHSLLKRLLLSAVLVVLTGSLAYSRFENRQKDAAIQRVRQFDFVQRIFSNTTNWEYVPGRTSRKGKTPLDPIRTRLTLGHTGLAAADSCTTLQIFNPGYTEELAKADYEWNFDGTKVLGGMERQGFKSNVFTDGKRAWTFPAKNVRTNVQTD